MIIVLGRIGISLGLILFVAWLSFDLHRRTLSRPWLARSIAAMLGSFAFLSTFALAVIRWPSLGAATAPLYAAIGALSITIGVAVWVPTVRAWLASRGGR